MNGTVGGRSLLVVLEAHDKSDSELSRCIQVNNVYLRTTPDVAASVYGQVSIIQAIGTDVGVHLALYSELGDKAHVLLRQMKGSLQSTYSTPRLIPQMAYKVFSDAPSTFAATWPIAAQGTVRATCTKICPPSPTCPLADSSATCIRPPATGWTIRDVGVRK